MKRYFYIVYKQSQYNHPSREFVSVIDKTVGEFLVWSIEYIKKYPSQKYDMPIILYSIELTKEEFNKLKGEY